MHRYAALALFTLTAGLGVALTAGSRSDAPAADGPAGAGAVPGIVFVAAPVFDEAADGGKGVYQGSYHWRDGYVYARSATYHRRERTEGPVRPGKNLYALVPAAPDGKLTRLTHLKSGAVFKPEPYFDGRKVLFSMRRDGEDWFHLYEVNVDGSGLRQLTDGPFNDFAGVYLPDGKIVFCSDRTGYLEEYHEERTETLFTMNGDGTGVRQITFAPGTYFEPTVVRDGRILFSFWDAFHIDVPPFDKHETFLMTVNPDGTEERHFFGNGQYQFFGRERHSGVGLTQPREMPDGTVLVQSELGPSIVDPAAGLSARDALAPVFPGTTSVQLGGTTHRAHLSPLGARNTARPLADGRFLFSMTPPGARDSGIYIGDPKTRQESLVLNIPDYAEFDAVPVLVERERPRQLPVRDNGGKTTRFLVVAGHAGDNPARAEAMKKARYFRVVQAEYSAVTTSSHTNLETQILGVVPVHPDGSAYFEAPADTPVFLDPLDAGGNRLLMEWTYPDTSVAVGTQYPATQMAYMVGRSGETKACYGCHAAQTDAVPNVPVLALKHPPVQVTRESTDLEYRRNDPTAYRRQARLGEAAKYRPWLTGDDPELRARACELLMHTEDGTEKDVPAIAELLGDDSADVRRAAALALTRLATTDQAGALRKALQDADWQVRFSAQAALDALEMFPDYREELRKQLPDVRAIRVAGKKRDAAVVPLLVPWLTEHKWEFHAAEAALALGRIGTREAVAALWQAVRSEVPLKSVHIARYLQRGPRPEEYALLHGLWVAGAGVSAEDIYLLLALLPNTFMEKPRYEDRLRDESQRVLMPRQLLERSGHRRWLVGILLNSLRGKQDKSDPLYQQILKGVNLERPFAEHGREFPVVDAVGPEEAVWLLGALIEPTADIDTPDKLRELEDLVRPLLTSASHRERIDTAVLLGRTGFGPRTAAVLAREAAKPYTFPEITSIGHGMPGTPFRDKAYLVQTLARHVADVQSLERFADPKAMYRDIRYGLVRGLARRGRADGMPLLAALASRDPLTVVRQQARYAIADIQDAYRLRGEPVPEAPSPREQPLEALYPPRGLTWEDTAFAELPPRTVEVPPAPLTPKNLLGLWQPTDFRNLNMAQASGSAHLMTAHVEQTRLAFERLAGLPPDQTRPTLLAALDTPYPFAHYLAADIIGRQGDRAAIPTLVQKLDQYLAKQDTVGFWWCCDALGRLHATEAIPTLGKYATAENPPGTFGPAGMPTGYIAARTLGQIIADATDGRIAPLLKSENIWLRAGTLRGLAEANAPGIEQLLEEAAQPDQPALVRSEAEIFTTKAQRTQR